jgi:hypothetical protein
VFGSATAGGWVRAAASRLRPKLTLFIRTVYPPCRYNILKNLRSRQCRASREQCLRDTGKKANFANKEKYNFRTNFDFKSIIPQILTYSIFIAQGKYLTRGLMTI